MDDRQFRDSSASGRAYATGPALEAHYRLMLWLIPAAERFPRSQKFLLGDQIQSIALDVLERIIAATYTRRRVEPLAGVNMGLEKLRVLFRLARDPRVLNLRRYEHAARSIDDTGRRVGAWSKAHHARKGAERLSFRLSLENWRLDIRSCGRDCIIGCGQSKEGSFDAGGVPPD